MEITKLPILSLKGRLSCYGNYSGSLCSLDVQFKTMFVKGCFRNTDIDQHMKTICKRIRNYLEIQQQQKVECSTKVNKIGRINECWIGQWFRCIWLRSQSFGVKFPNMLSWQRLDSMIHLVMSLFHVPSSLLLLMTISTMLETRVEL